MATEIDHLGDLIPQLQAIAADPLAPVLTKLDPELRARITPGKIKDLSTHAKYGQVPGGGVISAAMLSRAPDQATRAADGNAVTASASATPPPSSTSNFNKAIASTLR